jgi:LysR family transcriptional regulator, nitrogen assimilation regulatory protein
MRISHTCGRAAVVDFRQLRYFVGIVDEQSISLAAKRLRVAQPALSHHVRSLEADLGVPLLVRGVRGVKPTEAGERLYAYAVNILNYVDEAADRVRRFGAEPQGLVTLGLPTSVALVLAVPLVEAVCRELPHVRLRLIEGMSGHILEWLQAHRVDFAMLFDVKGPKTLVTQALLTEDLYVVCPPGESSGKVSFAEAATFPLIVPGRPHGLRERLELAARKAGLSLNIKAEIDALPEIKLLVQRGVGSSILSLSAVREEREVRLVEVRSIVKPSLQRTVHLCQVKGRPLTHAAEAVRQITLRVVQDLVTQELWPGRPSSSLFSDRQNELGGA